MLFSVGLSFRNEQKVWSFVGACATTNAQKYRHIMNDMSDTCVFVTHSLLNTFCSLLESKKSNNKHLPLVLANTRVSHNYNKKVVGLEQSLTKKRSTCRETLTRKRYPVSRRYFFFSYETFFQFQLLSLLYDLPWTLLSTFAASYTFFSVDKGNVILYGYCSKFTLFHTDSTADTSHFTNGHNFFSFVL